MASRTAWMARWYCSSWARSRVRPRRSVIQGAELGRRHRVSARQQPRLALDQNDVEAPEVGPEQRKTQKVGHEQVVDRASIPLDLLTLEDPRKHCGRADGLRLAVSDRAAQAVDHLEVGLADIPEPQLGMDRDRQPLEVARGGMQEVDERRPERVLGCPGERWRRRAAPGGRPGRFPREASSGWRLHPVRRLSRPFGP